IGGKIRRTVKIVRTVMKSVHFIRTILPGPYGNWLLRRGNGGDQTQNGDCNQEQKQGDPPQKSSLGGCKKWVRKRRRSTNTKSGGADCAGLRSSVIGSMCRQSPFCLTFPYRLARIVAIATVQTPRPQGLVNPEPQARAN